MAMSKEKMKMSLSSKRLGLLVSLAVLCASAFAAPSASAEFGIADWDGSIASQGVTTPYTQAGGHPYEAGTVVEFNAQMVESQEGPRLFPDAAVKDVIAELPPGLIGNPTRFAQCTGAQLQASNGQQGEVPEAELCPIDSIVGTSIVTVGTLFGQEANIAVPIYNMVAPRGAPARFGFSVIAVPVLIDAAVRGEGADLHIGLDSKNISQALPLTSARVIFWGNPYDSSHDGDRCWKTPFFLGEPTHPLCTGTGGYETEPHSVGGEHPPFVTMPTSCTAPNEGLDFDVAIDSWEQPGVFETDSFTTHEAAPNDAVERGTENCGVVSSDPKISLQPTAKSAETASGLDVKLEVPTDGFLNGDGVSQSHLKKVEVTLPEGMSINPSQADGLGVCTPAQYGAETAQGAPGTGCPSTSKIGTVAIDSPALYEPIPGNLYVAAPYDNPFGSLLALYVVAKDPFAGVMIKTAGKVTPNPVTGQLTTTFDNLPQAPFESFDLHFREGQHSPLSTPRTCGSFETLARFTPWSNPAQTITRTANFQITSGVGGGACPTGGIPPFKPGLQAGTINNRAGSYSPFNVRLTRNDGEQEFTNFSIKLPPGVVGKIAGIGYCSDAAIAMARQKTGAQELASPSCPASSQVGKTLAGAGVGSALVYAPGKIYYAGPYNGAPISIAAITAAKVGPFDLGTVVVRFALKVNPDTAEIFIDSTGSDPIPHIIQGIPVHIRDIRAYNDRPEFVLNPTSCERTSTASTVLGSGLNFASLIDDVPVTVSTPFQAADCAALGFKPDLRIALKGGTKRGGHPALKATLRMPPGNANIEAAQVTLPKSAFLDQSHIGTVCTRVQFNQGTVPGERCPPASVYGKATAYSPLLDTPLTGPVFLRSSEHKLPDLVAALHSRQIDVNVVGRIDSLDGRIRNTFESVPDAPVSRFVLTMAGGKKGLLENSTNLCAKPNRAIARFDGHNGAERDYNPVVKPQCGKARKKKKASKPSAPQAAPTPYRPGTR
jgi:hypothetical protein